MSAPSLTKPPQPSVFKLEHARNGLLHEQIANHFRAEILSGAYPQGAHLPTCQHLSKMLGVAAQTVNRAFDILDDEELVFRRRSVGTVVKWGKKEFGEISRSPWSRRQSVLPICHLARMDGVINEESDLYIDYLNGFTQGFDVWKSRFEVVHLREAESDLDMARAMVEHKQARGLVVLPLVEEAMDYLREANFPVVFLNVDASRHGVTSVVADHVRGYSDAWSFVDTLGHREAAFFGYDTPNFALRSRECLSGRVLAQPRCGFSLAVKAPENAAPCGIFSALVDSFGPWSKGATNSKWPSLIFTQTDLIATRVMRALRENGIRVPTDISIIGFNDASIAKHWDPMLTTLAKPRYQMALAASRLLLDLVAERPAAKGALQTFPVRLIERESCTAWRPFRT